MEMTMKHARVSVVGLAMLLGSCATAPKPVPVTPATTPPAPAINPFADATLFVNPEYTKSVEALIPAHAGEAIYKLGIAYAIAKLSLPNVFLYLDAAHAGWLGWPKNLVKTAPMFKEILTMAGGPDRIRGFATDVSNYNPAKDPTNPKRDP